MSERPEDLPPRLLPDVPLPPYSYVDGRFPHPLRDPKGHSYGRQPQATPAFDPADWQKSQPYLHGIDLFNHGYYWEAHEAWEEVWNACGRRGVTADFIKGLIKLAAAGVKVREGRTEGVTRHALRALAILRQTAAAMPSGETHFLGLPLEPLMAAAQETAHNPPTCNSADAPVEIVFSFRLMPKAY